MEVTFKIIYHETVIKKDIPKLPKSARKNIKRAIETKLMVQPEYFGKPLRRSLKGYRKLRVGDYRIIFSIEKRTIKVMAIGHRSVIYSKQMARFFN